MNKNYPVLRINDNGSCEVLNAYMLPFSLRKMQLSYADYYDWASNRALSIDRVYSRELLDSLRLSRQNRYAVFLGCRGLSLQDTYWIRSEAEDLKWEDVSLFRKQFPLFLTEVSLSGQNLRHDAEERNAAVVHTPELTTMGVNAKAWIRHADGLYLHKTGICELAADDVLSALEIPHIMYRLSGEGELETFLSAERKEWIESIGEAMVCSKLFTSEECAFVTFEEFELYCNARLTDAYSEAMAFEHEAFHRMQVADYLLNNTDRHKQNWGFFMDTETGSLTCFCPLFDHDRAFSDYENTMSQTSPFAQTMFDAAKESVKYAGIDIGAVFQMPRPETLSEAKWDALLCRAGRLLNA